MSVAAQATAHHLANSLQVALVVSGFTSIVAQVVLLRELFVAFYGNELSIGLTLAIWLLWTAVGSAFLGRLLRTISVTPLFGSLQIAVSIALFVSIVLAQTSRQWWSATPGEALGPVPMLATALVALCTFCPISGWLFTAGARAYEQASQRNAAESGSSMYLLEAAGSAIGGVLASVFFIRFFDSLQIASVVAIANGMAASQLLIRRRTVRRVIGITVIASGIAAIVLAPRVQWHLVQKSWAGFHVIAATNSPYGNLAVVQTEGNRSLIQNGLVLFTVPDLAAAEESVHFALLEHAAPRSILLVGGGLNGGIAEILRHPTVQRVDYVELDPTVITVTRRDFANAWNEVAGDSRVHMHLQDGRLFLKTSERRFDVIIVNVPEPQTAQLNRFYTQEFFAEGADKLAPGGVMTFHLKGAEEYISPDLAKLLGSIRSTLGRVFPNVIVIPGETVHFIASPAGTELTRDPELLLRRLRERGVQTTYMREYYLPFRMAPDRIADLDEQLRSGSDLRVNRDFTPVAYYFDVALWSSQFSSRYRDAFVRAARTPFRNALIAWVVFTCSCVVLLRIGARSSGLGKAGAGFATLATGLTVMGTEVLLMLGFQAVFGYVFNELAIIVAGFMTGMALGSWFALRWICNTGQGGRTDLLRLAFIQMAIAASPLLVVAALAGVDVVRTGWLVSIVAHLGFPFAATLFGIAGGCQFPIAMKVFAGPGGGSPGSLYALDLAGAAIAALAISAFVLPVFGFEGAAVLMTVPSLGALGLISIALGKHHSRFA